MPTLTCLPLSCSYGRVYAADPYHALAPAAAAAAYGVGAMVRPSPESLYVSFCKDYFQYYL